MDFLKTLLAYMTLLATLSVQEGPAPETVPTPTPLPPSVTASPVPYQSDTPTATPGPVQTAAPTITPNYRYETLDYGSSGAGVRKLQNALIELGYMPEGSADGQYGYQTYNAVKAFQKANGLSADGVAGAATLTNLYENPNVLGVVADTPVPTATPTPTLPPLTTRTPTPETTEPDPSQTPEPVVSPEAEPAEEAEPLEETDPDAAADGEGDVVLSDGPAEAAASVPGLTRVDGGFIISGNTGSALYIEQTIGSQQALVKPGLWQNADGDAVVALPQLADCLGWQLIGSSTDGLYTLDALGYRVTIQLSAEAVDVTVDDAPIAVDMDDVFLADGMLYVTDAFLQKALGAATIFDVDEYSLVLFLTEKIHALAND